MDRLAAMELMIWSLVFPLKPEFSAAHPPQGGVSESGLPRIFDGGSCSISLCWGIL